MSETTTYNLRYAIKLALDDYGDAALWSDGAADWTLDNYLDAVLDAHGDDGDCGCEYSNGILTTPCQRYENQPVQYDGMAIYGYDTDGLRASVPIVRLVPSRGQSRKDPEGRKEGDTMRLHISDAVTYSEWMLGRASTTAEAARLRRMRGTIIGVSVDDPLGTTYSVRWADGSAAYLAGYKLTTL